MTDQTPAQYTGPRRILSGIQASGALHLGNYLGALKRFTELQETGAPLFVFVADMHAITVWQEPEKLAAQTREIAAAYRLVVAAQPSRNPGMSRGWSLYRRALRATLAAIDGPLESLTAALGAKQGLVEFKKALEVLLDL